MRLSAVPARAASAVLTNSILLAPPTGLTGPQGPTVASCENAPHMLQRLLALPETADLDVDGPNRLEVHAAVLRRKPMLAAVFRECHELMLRLDRRTFGDTPGLRVELGAGVAPVAGTFSEVLATDVVRGPGLDAVLDAQCLDLPDGSVRALYGQNCFHHFPDPLRFLVEAERVVAPGGGVLLIEPYYGLLASVVFRRLFASEDFDKTMPGWTNDATGPMHGANQALSYIVFNRDRARFERELPNLELVETFPLGNYLRYLLSGGLNFRQLVPTFTEPVLHALELALRPARRVLALHHVIVLRRRGR
jgi:SAM-dependent methyltransferase